METTDHFSPPMDSVRYVVNPFLTIDENMDVVGEYLKDLLAIESKNDILALIAKWGNVVPVCKALLSVEDCEVPALKKFLATEPDKQNTEWIDQNKVWLSVRMPRNLMTIVSVANEYKVTTGLVVAQWLRTRQNKSCT